MKFAMPDFQNGGNMRIVMTVASLFHNPSLLDPFTLKVYSPGGKFV